MSSILWLVVALSISVLVGDLALFPLLCLISFLDVDCLQCYRGGVSLWQKICSTPSPVDYGDVLF